MYKINPYTGELDDAGSGGSSVASHSVLLENAIASIGGSAQWTTIQNNQYTRYNGIPVTIFNGQANPGQNIYLYRGIVPAGATITGLTLEFIPNTDITAGNLSSLSSSVVGVTINGTILSLVTASLFSGATIVGSGYPLNVLGSLPLPFSHITPGSYLGVQISIPTNSGPAGIVGRFFGVTLTYTL